MTSYLMVNEWKGDKLIDQHLTRLFKRVNAFGSKARGFARQYEAELNSADFSEDKQAHIKALTEDKTWYSVTAVPDSQAREFNDYPTWEECPLYK